MAPLAIRTVAVFIGLLTSTASNPGETGYSRPVTKKISRTFLHGPRFIRIARSFGCRLVMRTPRSIPWRSRHSRYDPELYRRPTQSSHGRIAVGRQVMMTRNCCRNDGQPDGTIAIKRYWRGTFVFGSRKASVGAGFDIDPRKIEAMSSTECGRKIERALFRCRNT